MIASLILLLAGHVGPDDAPHPPSRADLDLVRSIADRAEENRRRFPFGRVEFRTQEGSARSPEDARAGRLDRLAEAPSLYAFDASHQRFERLYSPADLAANPILRSVRVATNGKLELHEALWPSPDGASTRSEPTLEMGSRCFLALAAFPLELGMSTLNAGIMSRALRSALDGTARMQVSAVDRVVHEGNPVIRVRLETLNDRDEKGRVEFWVDPARGAVPVYQRTEIRGNARHLYRDRIELVAGRGWLPMVETRCLDGGRVNRLVVDRVDFAEPPGPEAFLITLDAPAKLVDPLTKAEFPEARRVWDLDHLPAAQPLSLPSAPGPD